MRLRLTLAYTGTHYYGWQAQKSGLPTIQGALTQAWKSLTGEDADFTAAGRTDAGVHARAQVVHIDTAWPHATITAEQTPPLFSSPFPRMRESYSEPQDIHQDCIKVTGGLNRFLPPTIRILSTQVTNDTFHARFSATARTYHYRLVTARTLPPEWHTLAGHALGAEATLMQQALTHLPLGEHDFSSFRDAECQSRTPLCTLTHRSLTQNPDGTLTFQITADHFLHHMVRNLVGTLVDIGQGKRPPDALPAILAQKDRRAAGPTFSPHGLFLHHIHY